MPFTGNYTYTPLADYARKNADADLSARFGTVQGTGINTTDKWINGLFGDTPVQYANPYYGKDAAGVLGQYAGGQDLNSWFDSYINKNYGGAPEGRPTLVNGQVRENIYQDPGDKEGLAVMAALTAGMGGMAAGAAAAGGAGAGAAGGGGSYIGSGLVDGLGAAAYEGAGAAGAGAAGAGALGTGIDASTGLYAGESGVATTGAGSAAAAGGAAAGAGALGQAGSAAGSALSRILSGAGTAADYASILGTAGSTALGVYGSNQQADSLRQIAEQARTDRQPYLNKSLEWLNNPQSYAEGPGKFALDSTLRALSVQGNPIGNPGNLAIAGDIANRGWQNAVTGFGNLGLAGQDSRNQLLSSAATADRGVTTALSSGLGSLTQPQQMSLTDLAKAFGIQGLA